MIEGECDSFMCLPQDFLPKAMIKTHAKIFFLENSCSKQDTKDSKKCDKASVADAENPRPCVAVGNGGGNRVKGCLGRGLGQNYYQQRKQRLREI